MEVYVEVIVSTCIAGEHLYYRCTVYMDNILHSRDTPCTYV